MEIQQRLASLVGLIGGLLATACGASAPTEPSIEVPDGNVHPPTGAPDASAEPTFEPTFSAVYSEVVAAHNCLLGLCHGEGASGGGLSLFPRSRAHGNLLAPSTSFACRDLGLALIDPGRPENSLFWLKIGPDPQCGSPMPPDRAIDERHLEQTRAWIARGAPDD